MDEHEKTLEGVLAASLSIVAGVGHLYLGQPRGYYILGVGIALILTWKLFWPPAQLLYISLAIFTAVDAFAIAKRGRGLL